jgi:hypothetical protein
MFERASDDLDVLLALRENARQSSARLRAAQANVEMGVVPHVCEVATALAAPAAQFFRKLFCITAAIAVREKYAAAHRSGMVMKVDHNLACLRQRIGFDPMQYVGNQPVVPTGLRAICHSFTYRHKRTHVRGNTRSFVDPDLALCGEFWPMQMTSWIALQANGRYAWTDASRARLTFVVAAWESYADGGLTQTDCMARAASFPLSSTFQDVDQPLLTLHGG